MRIALFLSGCLLLTNPLSSFAASVSAPGSSSSGGSTSTDSWPGTDAGDAIFANSLANAICIGAGVVPVCIYEDGTLGGVIRPAVDADTRTYVWTNKNWHFFDVEGNRDIITADPDAFATGSGTVTMQTGYQFGASNLGISYAPSDTNPTCSAGTYLVYADLSEAVLKLCNNGTLYTFSQELTIRKTADETVNNSTVLQNDDSFVFAATANTIYAVKLFILYDSAQAADFKYNFTLPASATGWKATASAPLGTTVCSSGSSASLIFNSLTQENANVGGAGTGTSNTCAFVVDATVVTAGTAGNVQFQWAQAVADATDTVVRANSWMTYRRIP